MEEVGSSVARSFWISSRSIGLWRITRPERKSQLRGSLTLFSQT